MNKAEISDLKALIDRSEECAVNLKQAEQAKFEATRTLLNWLNAHLDPPVVQEEAAARKRD